MSEDPGLTSPPFTKKDAQELRYMVPGLSPHTTLGVAVAKEIHDQACGSSPATAMARATR